MTEPTVIRMMSALEVDERTFDDENRTVKNIVASDEAIDSHGSKIKADGWDLERFNRNPVLDWYHASVDGWNKITPDDILGTASLKVKGKKLVGDLHFEPAELNPQAEKVYQKIKAKTIRMVSVAFKPKKYHYEVVGKGSRDLLVIDEAELVSLGVVPLGSNPNAFINSYQEMRSFCEKYAELSGERPMSDNQTGASETPVRSDTIPVPPVPPAPKPEDPIAKELAESKARLAELEQKDIDRSIDDAILAGRAAMKVVPAMVSVLKKIGKLSVDVLKELIGALPSIRALAASKEEFEPASQGLVGDFVKGRKWDSIPGREKARFLQEHGKDSYEAAKAVAEKA